MTIECTKCNNKKPITSFTKNNQRKNGLTAKCKVCLLERLKELKKSKGKSELESLLQPEKILDTYTEQEKEVIRLYNDQFTWVTNGFKEKQMLITNEDADFRKIAYLFKKPTRKITKGRLPMKWRGKEELLDIPNLTLRHLEEVELYHRPTKTIIKKDILSISLEYNVTRKYLVNVMHLGSRGDFCTFQYYLKNIKSSF